MSDNKHSLKLAILANTAGANHHRVYVFCLPEELAARDIKEMFSDDPTFPLARPVLSVDINYIWNAIAFTKAERTKKLLTDTVAGLRISRDLCSDAQAKETLTAQIKDISEFLDEVNAEYTHNKSLLSN